MFLPCPDDLCIIRLAFDAPIHGQIIVRSVHIIFTVRFIVLFVIGNKIIERKSVMGSYKIYTGAGRAIIVLIQVSASGKPLRKFCQANFIASPVSSYTITVLTVPFGPAGWKITDLVSTFAHIPGLGN